MVQKYLFVLVLLLCMPAHAGQNTITVASPASGWPPFIIPSGGSAGARGIMIDVMREVTKSAGYQLQLEIYPEKRCRMLLEEGVIDAYPKAKEWMVEPANYLWTDPVVISTDVVVFNKSAPLLFKKVNDLKGRSLGIVRGFHYPSLHDHFQSESIKCHEAKDTESILRMVQRGHIDGAVTNSHVAQWLISTNTDLKQESFAFSSVAIGRAPYRFAFAKRDYLKPFVAHFNAELAAMKNDGRFNAILNKYN